MSASDLEQRLRALKQQFVEGLPARASEIEAWLEGDRAVGDIARIAHRLRGVAPSYGLTVLGALAASIEDGCKVWDAQRIEAAARDLHRALHESTPASRTLDSPTMQATRAPAASTPQLLAGYRVVAIDDDPLMRRLLMLTLETVGGASAVVLGSADAMESELLRAPADLVISDLMMPEESGPDLLRSLASRDLLKHAVIVLLSATAEVELRGRDALLEPSWIWLTKPFRPPQLVETLAGLLRTRDAR